MAIINKTNFFYGAFLDYIICNGVKEPTLFDSPDDSRILKFSLRNKDYKIYIKYTTSGTDRTKKEIKNVGKQVRYTRWSVPFSNAERDFLVDSFSEEEKENLVVLVCTNKNLSDTYFAVLKPDQAIRCLGDDAVNDSRSITLKKRRTKRTSYVSCYGTALDESNAISIEYNIDNVFGF